MTYSVGLKSGCTVQTDRQTDDLL